MTVGDMIKYLKMMDPDDELVVFKPGCVSPSQVIGVSKGASISTSIAWLNGSKVKGGNIVVIEYDESVC